MIRLETERILLRDHRWEDLSSHHRLLSDKKAMRYLPDLQTSTLEESKEDLAKSIESASCPDRTLYFFRMEERRTGEFIGEIGYTVTANTPLGKLVHLGYFSFASFWGKGYMTEGLREVLRFAFEENGVYRVTTGCSKENAGSERVMQKAGLIREAEHLDWEWMEGRMHTRMEYRLLRQEWLSRGQKEEAALKS